MNSLCVVLGLEDDKNKLDYESAWCCMQSCRKISAERSDHLNEWGEFLRVGISA